MLGIIWHKNHTRNVLLYTLGCFLNSESRWVLIRYQEQNSKTFSELKLTTFFFELNLNFTRLKSGGVIKVLT